MASIFGRCQDFQYMRDATFGNIPDSAHSSVTSCAQTCGSSTMNNGGPFPHAGFYSEGPDFPYCVCLARQSASPGMCGTCTNVGPCGIMAEGFSVYVFPSIAGAPSPPPPPPSSTSPPSPPPPPVTSELPPPPDDTQVNPGPTDPSPSQVTSISESTVPSNGPPASSSVQQILPVTSVTAIGSDGRVTVVPGPVVTVTVFGPGGNGGGGKEAQENSSSSSGSSFPTIGIAVGGALGIAVILAVTMVIVRQRKRKGEKKSLDGDFYRNVRGSDNEDQTGMPTSESPRDSRENGGHGIASPPPAAIWTAQQNSAVAIQTLSPSTHEKGTVVVFSQITTALPREETKLKKSSDLGLLQHLSSSPHFPGDTKQQLSKHHPETFPQDQKAPLHRMDGITEGPLGQVDGGSNDVASGSAGTSRAPPREMSRMRT
ncbi:hypothetical protein HDU67_002945, partial [Dinochytrium kinnereticum]